MEELMGKLVKAEDIIRLSTGSDCKSKTEQTYDSCRDILDCLMKETRRSRMHQWNDHQLALQKKLEKVTHSLMKTLRVQKRQRVRSADCSTGTGSVISEDSLMKLAQDLINELTTKVDIDDDPSNTFITAASTISSGLPSSVQEYKHRLEKHSKELYKNPPAMPPGHVVVIENDMNNLPRPPQRDSRTNRLTFFMPYEEYQTEKKKNASAMNGVVVDFHPNVTPEEILLEGAFGGTYFRNIHSAVTNIHYIGTDVIRDSLAPEWMSKYDTKSIATKLTSSTYRTAVNKFKVKCGGSLGMWESSGWISDVDPYGWFQWYCRFYRGRRSSDDARQISRWKALAGTKGRFKSQLCNKILQKASSMTTTASASSKQSRTAMPAAINDVSISPVVRQTLFHWGLVITEDVLQLHERLQKR